MASGGTQTDESWTEVDIGQDYLDCLGVTVQVAGTTSATSDATTYVSRPAAGAIALTDQLSGTLTLEQLLTSVTGKPGSHNRVADIIHYLADGGPGDGYASGMVQQVTSSGLLPTSVIWYTSSAMTSRIYGVAYTYTGVLVATQTQTLYVNNVAVRTVTDTFNYAANLFAPTITRTWT